MFNPGETVCHQFTIPFVADELAKVIVSYKQDGYIVFEKSITSGFESKTRTETIVNVEFTQEESLLFNEYRRYTIQLNVLTKLGTRASSKEIKSENGAQYHKEVMSDG